MNKISALLIGLALYNPGFSQKGDYIKRPALGIHFFLNDFETAYNIRTTSSRQVLKNDKIASISDMDPGFALSYMQGLSSHFDLSTSLSGSF